jgi:hypothetical protein
MRAAIFFCFVISAIGCATPSNDADQFKKISPSQRLYVGRMQVLLNGTPAEKCEVFVNGSLIPNLKIASDGYMIYRTDDSAPGLAKLTCLHKLNFFKSAWHMKDLNLDPIHKPKEQNTVHYFGDLKVDWTVDPKTTENAKVVESDPGPNKVGTVKNSGELKVTVENKLEDMRTYAAKTWKIVEGKQIEADLTSVRN